MAKLWKSQRTVKQTIWNNGSLWRSNQDLTVLTNPDIGYIAPGLSYTRTGTIYVPQEDGSLLSVASDVVPRTYEQGRWWYRVDPGWTNYGKDSTDCTTANWTKTRSSASTISATNSFGGSTVSALTEDSTASASHFCQFGSLSATAGQYYTLVTDIAPNGRNYAAVVFTGGGLASDSGIYVDLSSGQWTAGFGGSFAYTVLLLPNGYTRISVTLPAVTSSTLAGRIYICNSANNQVYAGNGVSGIKISVANVTNTAYPVPISLATSAAVNIGNPSWSGTLTALGLSLPGDFTLGAEFSPSVQAAIASSRNVLQIDSAFSDRAVIRAATTTGSVLCAVVSANSTTYGRTLTGSVEGGINKVAFRVGASSSNAALNRVINTPGPASPLPAITTVRVGNNNTVEYFAGLIGKTWISQNALPDNSLVAYTG